MTSKPRDPLADSLNIDSELAGFAPPAVIEQPERISEAVDLDYEFSRSTVIDTITKATQALDIQLDLAQQSQLPRAFEVVATMVKTIIDGSKDLLELSKRARELKGTETDESGPKTINNTLVVTTDQLQKLLQDQGVVTTTREVKKKEDPENGR